MHGQPTTPGPTYYAVTPAGAYHAVALDTPTPERRLLFRLLASPRSLSRDEIEDMDGPGSAERLARLSARDWLSALDGLEYAPTEPLERLLPELLPQLSERGRALLADHQGLAIGQSGFPDAEVHSLAALSADVLALGRRARQLLAAREQALPEAWASVDAAGNSRIGVWPIHLPERQFALAIEGRPLFVRAAFPQLVWTLARRYGGQPDHPPGG